MKSPGGGHGETGAAWDVVAKAKYSAEFDEHVAMLKAGDHKLLAPEVDVLGPLLQGSDVVQLQCSHGLDALGLLNLGARSVTGVDISAEMVAQAKAKAEAVGTTAASFLCSDVVNLPSSLAEKADLVYTGRGSLNWIHDIVAWAESVRSVLRPGGRAYIFEGHPLTALWERESDGLELREGATYFDEGVSEHAGFPSSVVERELGSDRPRMLERQWRPGEVMGALISAGLRIELFREYPDLFWDQFPEWPEELRRALPKSYAILVLRPLDRGST